MAKSESIQEFHQRNNLAFTPAAWGSGPPRHALGQINVFRRQDLGCKAATPYNRRDYYKISLVIGQGVLHYADKSILIDKDALLFSNPNIPYSWEALSEKQCGFFTLFTQDFISRTDSLQDSTLFRIGSEPVMFVDETQKSFYHDIFTRMLAEIESEYVHKYDVLRNYVNLILHEAMKTQRGSITYSHPNAATRIAALFIELLERQFPIDTQDHVLCLKTASDYAKHMNIHANHLNRAVKEVTGKTTTEHIAERITKEAKALLMHTKWNVSEVAYSLGYEHPAYFTNFFKKQTGSSPNNFRAEQAVV
ncbi:helix-turn-helix domain-containing protein [Pseudobacter ginsenosidimutans]|uniref:AraC-like DNA-binding protein n=1 Tax=Pseudobacter ginsenosidimutans TaxID=661488 RepID=A0A4Q7MCE3_9BACT|nr:helix-turn-helix domain-containing protein [Pseudobacter ginsenosidimutans]QEC42546.1 AraC family transcriptional regulator [Pseudobacter ginsenosidimutans]RZS63969.1 AraC-like DNA-binding protein [Pseudobacter ginsenosidimutans]